MGISKQGESPLSKSDLSHNAQITDKIIRLAGDEGDFKLSLIARRQKKTNLVSLTIVFVMVESPGTIEATSAAEQNISGTNFIKKDNLRIHSGL
jgi:hypothetical protein